jgi:hypothetical protein
VTRESFEQRLLHLWMTSRVAFTRPNLQFYSGVGRDKLERWLDELVAGGVLEVDSDDAGELVWTVVGAERPRSGATHVAEVVKLEQLKGEVASTRALVKRAATSLSGPPAPGGGEHKSLIASGALSFFLGPLGWLYAAPLKDAAPAIVVFLVLMMIMPHLLLGPLLGILLPLSGAAGVAYAWGHNQRGRRISLADAARGKLPPRE